MQLPFAKPRYKNNTKNSTIFFRIRKFKQLKYFIFILVIVWLAVLFTYLKKTEFWKVEKINFNKEKYIFLNNEIKKFENELKGENLLELDTKHIVNELSKNPYVEKTFIQKKYPSEVYIHIEEATPYLYLITVNELILYDNEGNHLFEYKLSDNYEISELERQIYKCSQTFKNELVKNKWLADNEKELQEKYKKFLENEDIKNNDITNNDLELKNNKQKTFEKFIDDMFEKEKINDLDNYYQIILKEIKLAINQRWDMLSKVIDQNIDVPVIYSIIDKDNIFRLDENIKHHKFIDFKKNVNKVIKINRIEFLESRIFALYSQKNNRQIKLIFDKERDLNYDLLRLQRILLELKQKNKTFDKIDLSGKKIVVKSIT